MPRKAAPRFNYSTTIGAIVERILLKGGCVLTLDPDIGNYPKGDVLIEGHKIAAVGPLLRVSGAEVIGATNTIVMLLVAHSEHARARRRRDRRAARIGPAVG